MSTEFDHIWLLRIVSPALLDRLKVQHFVPHFFYSQSLRVSKARAGRTAGPAAEPEVYSCWCGEDQQREEGTPADHHQSQQVSGRCRTAQVEWRDRSGQSEGEGTHSLLMCLHLLAAYWQLLWLLMCLSCHASIPGGAEAVWIPQAGP